MNIKIRNELPHETRLTELVTREAFWNYFQPGSDEHFILHNLRNSDDFIPELNFVAEVDGEIVGSIVYSKSLIKSADMEYPVITFGPLCVLEEYRKKGIGEQLVNHSINLAKALGYNAIIILGDPRYYHKFGFRCGEKYDITCFGGKYATALLVLPLKDTIISGEFTESDAFNYEPSELEIFDKNFPKKEKSHTKTQDMFQLLQSLIY